MSTRQGMAVVVAVALFVGVVSCAAIRSCRRHRPTTKVAPRQSEKYADELPFRAAREIEHTWWAGDPPYQTWRDLEGASERGELIGAPDWLDSSTLFLSRGIGKRDRKHQSLYWMASPEVWEVVRELSERTAKGKVGSKRFRIESLARCVGYPLGQGSKTSSHNFGRAFDIDLDDSGLTLSELTRLHEALYLMAGQGKLVYYVEGNAARGGRIPVFPVPYNFSRGGQVHVVVAPPRPVLKPAKVDLRLGRGVWIYVFGSCEGGDPDKILRRARSAGLDSLYVKMCDWRKRGGYGWYAGNEAARAQILRLVSLCHERNIRVFAWGFHYGDHPELEAKFALKCLELPFDGYILDVEGQSVNEAGALEQTCARLRAERDLRYPRKVLGYTTFARVDIGAGRDLRQAGVLNVLGTYCDVAMPQAYWGDFADLDFSPAQTMDSVHEAWAAMYEQWAETERGEAIKPIVPMGQAYRAGQSGLLHIPAPDLKVFLAKADEFGYGGTGLWSWQHMGREHWRYLWWSSPAVRCWRALALAVGSLLLAVAIVRWWPRRKS